ncbi:MAG TPA: glutamine-hydrolyzing carbamoyl-phosphate synthase small subunit [Nitrososphaerales archaeon]|nr:glutamine-hydrolyzing carbamoyl-phosphate synthase small subunit [Nitrososphaerales archaeon]
MPNAEQRAVLVLEDGTIFPGVGFGAEGTVSGEVVFNTGMVGYPESLTDPSYFGQILVQTWPLVGNYGVPSRDLTDGSGLPLHFESDSVKVSGYVVAEVQRCPSHWSSRASLPDWLKASGVPGVSGVDTRELTKKLRTKGTMLGLISVGPSPDLERLKRSARILQDPNSTDLVRRVSTPRPVEYGGTSDTTVVLIDCGVKFGILRSLVARGFRVVQVPYDTSAAEILARGPAGVVVSNGPGDPATCRPVIESVRSLLETEVPLLGICLGTQILVLAAGGTTYKLKFGHRAQNHPCADLRTGRAYMTTQNHGYSVDAKSLEQFEVSFVNLNDKTVEGIMHKRKPVGGVQFHPEASPGPFETGFIFDEFAQWVRGFQSQSA